MFKVALLVFVMSASLSASEEDRHRLERVKEEALNLYSGVDGSTISAIMDSYETYKKEMMQNSMTPIKDRQELVKSLLLKCVFLRSSERDNHIDEDEQTIMITKMTQSLSKIKGLQYYYVDTYNAINANAEHSKCAMGIRSGSEFMILSQEVSPKLLIQ